MNIRNQLTRILALMFLPCAVQAQSWESIPVTPGVGDADFVSNPTNADHLAGTLGSSQEVVESFDGGFTWSAIPVPAVAEFDSLMSAAFEADGTLCMLGRADGVSDGRKLLVRRTGTGQWEVGGPSIVDSLAVDLVAYRLASSGTGATAMAVFSRSPSIGSSQTALYYTTGGGAAWDRTWPNWYGHASAFTDLGFTQTGPGQERLLHARASVGFWPYSYFISSYDPQLGTSTLLRNNDVDSFVASGRVAPEVVSVTRAPKGFSGSPMWGFDRSEDGGNTWSEFALPPSGGWRELLRGEVDADLLVSIEGFDLTTRLSRDRGTTWTELPALPSVGPSAFSRFHISPDDRWLYASLPNRFLRFPLHESVGTVACVSQPTGTGAPATLQALGSTSIASDDLLLWTRGMLVDQFGIYIASLTPGNVPGAGGSFGTLCLGGSIGRFAPSLMSGSYGEFAQRLNLSEIATPTGQIAVQPGDTWFFQSWFRDGINGVAGSNFSSAVSVTFLP